MIGSATVTADTGPGNTVTSLALASISKIELDLAKEVCRVYHIKNGKPTISEFDLVGVTALTTTITGVTGSAVTFVLS